MKKVKILLICFCATILIGCSNYSNNDAENACTFSHREMTETRDIEIEVEYGIYYAKDWTSDICTYQGNAIPNAETALAVASAVFAHMEKSAEDEKFVPQSVFYDIEDGIWIISFWEDNRNPNKIGYCYSIAIQESDGKILRIWFGE